MSYFVTHFDKQFRDYSRSDANIAFCQLTNAHVNEEWGTVMEIGENVNDFVGMEGIRNSNVNVVIPVVKVVL